MAFDSSDEEPSFHLSHESSPNNLPAPVQSVHDQGDRAAEAQERFQALWLGKQGLPSELIDNINRFASPRSPSISQSSRLGKRKRSTHVVAIATTCSLFHLPDELVLMIMSFLDVENLSRFGRSCWDLHGVCREEMIKRDVTSANNRALAHAFRDRHVDLINYCMQIKTPFKDAKLDRDLDMAFMANIELFDSRVVDLFLTRENGPSANSRSIVAGHRPLPLLLSKAVESRGRKCAALMVRMLVKHGAYPDIEVRKEVFQSNPGKHPLILALEAGRWPCQMHGSQRPNKCLVEILGQIICAGVNMALQNETELVEVVSNLHDADRPTVVDLLEAAGAQSLRIHVHMRQSSDSHLPEVETSPTLTSHQADP